MEEVINLLEGAGQERIEKEKEGGRELFLCSFAVNTTQSGLPVFQYTQTSSPPTLSSPPIVLPHFSRDYAPLLASPSPPQWKLEFLPDVGSGKGRGRNWGAGRRGGRGWRDWCVGVISCRLWTIGTLMSTRPSLYYILLIGEWNFFFIYNQLITQF